MVSLSIFLLNSNFFGTTYVYISTDYFFPQNPHCLESFQTNAKCPYKFLWNLFWKEPSHVQQSHSLQFFTKILTSISKSWCTCSFGSNVWPDHGLNHGGASGKNLAFRQQWLLFPKWILTVTIRLQMIKVNFCSSFNFVTSFTSIF